MCCLQVEGQIIGQGKMGAKVYRLDPTYLKKPPDRSGHNGLRIGTGGRFRYSLSSRCPQQAFRHWPVAVAFYVTHRAELDSTASTTTAIPHGPGILATCGRPYTAWYDMSQSGIFQAHMHCLVY